MDDDDGPVRASSAPTSHSHHHRREPRRRREDIQTPPPITGRTPLLDRHGWDEEPAHPGPCDHGTFSPRPVAHPITGFHDDRDDPLENFGALDDGVVPEQRHDALRRVMGDRIADRMSRTLNKLETVRTRRIAQGHHVPNKTVMYVFSGLVLVTSNS